MKIFQFRIALRNIEPAIWRRVQVSSGYSFWDLHCAVQDAMGWWDDHLHSFQIPVKGSEECVEIGIPDSRGFGTSKVRAGWKTRVDEYLKEEGDWVFYLYDFGDGWGHELELEKVLDPEEGVEYPRCVDGARACPPEDCGGSWRYGHMLEVIADPDHEEYESMMDWLGDEYEPEKFSSDDVNFLDPGMRLRSLLIDRGESDTDLEDPEDDYDGPTAIDDIMRKLTYYRGEFQRKALEAAIDRKEEITPLLLKALEDLVERSEKYIKFEEYVLHFNALLLLAQFRETRAYPLVMEVCKLPEENLDLLFGDFLTEYMGRIIASVFDGDTARIKSVVEDASLYEYARATALTALQILVHMGVLKREDVIDYYIELFRGGLEKEYSLVWDELACEAVDLHAVELADDIQKKYETGFLDPSYMTPTEAKRELALPEEEALRTAKEKCRGPIDDAVSIMERWLSPSVKRNRHPVLDENFGSSDEYYRDGHSLKRVEPKVSRNDPCPCGSGKKYKKCCGK